MFNDDGDWTWDGAFELPKRRYELGEKIVWWAVAVSVSLVVFLGMGTAAYLFLLLMRAMIHLFGGGC